MPFERHCIISKKLQSKKSDKTGHHGHMLFCSFSFTLSLVTASQICFKEAESASVSRSVMSDSLPPHGLWPVRILFPRNSPGKNTGVGSHSLLLTQGWILGLPHCIEILYQLSPIGCSLAKLSVWAAWTASIQRMSTQVPSVSALYCCSEPLVLSCPF